MTDRTGRHQAQPDAHHTIGRPRQREDLAEDFRRLDAAQRAAAAAASPTARALIQSSRAATYNRLAPLVADLDHTWSPATAPPIRTPSHGVYTQPPMTSRGDTVTTETVIDTAANVGDSTVLIGKTIGGDAHTGNRNPIIGIFMQAARTVRHPRRHRQG